eukprot:13865323-Alexandrium_andersonii.AAC.1
MWSGRAGDLIARKAWRTMGLMSHAEWCSVIGRGSSSVRLRTPRSNISSATLWNSMPEKMDE